MNLKWGVGGLSLAFIFGAVFWAGASYERLSGMERALVDIKGSIASFVSAQANSQMQTQQNTRDIEQLRKEVDRLAESTRGSYSR